jgi:hypothetical protein
VGRAGIRRPPSAGCACLPFSGPLCAPRYAPLCAGHLSSAAWGALGPQVARLLLVEQSWLSRAGKFPLLVQSPLRYHSHM